MTKPDKGSEGTEVNLYALIAEHKSLGYDVETRLAAAMTYVMNGNLKKTAKDLKIPYDTLKDWRYTEWWPVALAECRKRKQDEVDGVLTGIIHRGLEQVQDRLENGDTKLTQKGDKVKVPMPGKEVATTVGILFDKRAAMRGDPTTINRNSTSAEHLQALEQKLADFTKRLENSGAMASPIQGEFSNEEDTSEESEG